MAAKPFSKEQMNFLKFSILVLEEFPKVLRRIFILMWDSTVASKPGFTVWFDTATVRNMFLTSEGGNTVVPTSKSIEEWDCTALFAATIYAKTFGHNGLTLNDLYLKKTRPFPFHESVQGSTGNPLETYALVIDQLRLLRNTFFHSSGSEISQLNFDNYVFFLKNMLQMLKMDTTVVDDISRMKEEDFAIDQARMLEKLQKALMLSAVQKRLDDESKWLSEDIHKTVIRMKKEQGKMSGKEEFFPFKKR